MQRGAPNPPESTRQVPAPTQGTQQPWQPMWQPAWQQSWQQNWQPPRPPQAWQPVPYPVESQQVRRVDNRSPPKWTPTRNPSQSTSPKGGRAKSPYNPSVCYTCQREGRNALHPFRECAHWQKSQQSGGKRGSPPKSASGKLTPNFFLCLTCQAQGRSASHYYRNCPVWKAACEAKYGHKKGGSAKPQTPPKKSQAPENTQAKPDSAPRGCHHKRQPQAS